MAKPLRRSDLLKRVSHIHDGMPLSEAKKAYREVVDELAQDDATFQLDMQKGFDSPLAVMLQTQQIGGQKTFQEVIEDIESILEVTCSRGQIPSEKAKNSATALDPNRKLSSLHYYPKRVDFSVFWSEMIAVERKGEGWWKGNWPLDIARVVDKAREFVTDPARLHMKEASLAVDVKGSRSEVTKQGPAARFNGPLTPQHRGHPLQLVKMFMQDTTENAGSRLTRVIAGMRLSSIQVGGKMVTVRLEADRLINQSGPGRRTAPWIVRAFEPKEPKKDKNGNVVKEEVTPSVEVDLGNWPGNDLISFLRTFGEEGRPTSPSAAPAQK